MHPKNISISNYQYNLSDSQIAKYPLPKRDDSKLLVYNNGNYIQDQYKNIHQYIPNKSFIIFNQTKVINARLLFRKSTGAKIEIFCLEPHTQYSDVQVAMLQTQKVIWKCLVGGAAKWKDENTLTLIQPIPNLTFTAKKISTTDTHFLIEFEWDNPSFTFGDILQQAGELPIPPYLNRKTEASDLDTYQTMFAHAEGSVAAPTAALHFTPTILQNLAKQHITSHQITLHVGAGTFKPVKSSTMEAHDMHPEFIEVSVAFIQALIQHITVEESPVIAVGTTSVRTVESLYWIGVRIINNENIEWSNISVPQWYPYEHSQNNLPDTATALNALLQYLINKKLPNLITRTQIIIAPGYEFKIIQNIITNFHQPQSTLLLLIAAFIGDHWKDMYDFALENNYRFLSYGDGCLL